MGLKSEGLARLEILDRLVPLPSPWGPPWGEGSWWVGFCVGVSRMGVWTDSLPFLALGDPRGEGVLVGWFSA